MPIQSLPITFPNLQLPDQFYTVASNFGKVRSLYLAGRWFQTPLEGKSLCAYLPYLRGKKTSLNSSIKDEWSVARMLTNDQMPEKKGTIKFPSCPFNIINPSLDYLLG